jgi:hypothetical protein
VSRERENPSVDHARALSKHAAKTADPGRLGDGVDGQVFALLAAFGFSRPSRSPWVPG